MQVISSFAQHPKSLYLTISQPAQVFYEQIVNEVEPIWLLLIENEGV